MRVLTAAAMREVDRRAIEELGVPGPVLMENAALGVVEALAARFPQVERVSLVCGPGNNGGDGLAVARHLLSRGYEVRVALADGGRALSGDAALQLRILEAIGLSPVRFGPDGDPAPLLAWLAGGELLVDALFGTGLTRPLAGWAARLVEALDRLPLPRLAVDLPSGLDGDRPEIPGPALRADLTVTFAAPKVAQVLPPASGLVGDLVVADLGIPGWLVEEAPGGIHLICSGELAAALPPRAPESHKGSFGHLLLVAGSPGKAGAAILAARAAVAGGAGLVTVATPAPLAPTVELGSLESMTLALPASASGALALGGLGLLLAAAEARDAVALGPGLGEDPEAREVARRFALACSRPLVLDADGINAWAGQPELLRERRAPTVLTPHPGELARLLGREVSEVRSDRLGAVARAVEATGAFVVLKGHRSLVGTPDGEIHVNPTGGPAMASGGSGDVLTGLLGAFLAGGVEPGTAAALAVHLHGLAGDLAAAELGGPAVPAAELARFLPRAFAELERD
ncbi:MAG TPA: NAD(P)H-hydrate dehydratase [Thermoanaerobaculia bacterium]|nr:NAD(P)H-hydrate dehydratase [Thermoanaerobaculia bacterium]